MKQFEQAIAEHQRAIELRPDLPGPYNNLAASMGRCGKLEGTVQLLEKAVANGPTWAQAHWNLAIAMLLHGDFERGWKEYEWRWKWDGFSTPAPSLPQPMWTGEDLAGKRILLHAEQGFGDSIQFIRYASLIAERGGQPLWYGPPTFQRLFHCIPDLEVVPSEGPLPEFDFYCPLLSLPLAFETRMETIPADVPYLAADVVQTREWGRKLPKTPGKRRIGLAWAGSPSNRDDINRSIPLSQFAPVASARKATFFSLQKDRPANEPPAPFELVDLTADFHDFADTAAMLAHLDLVITVDTAVAHLAGAMRKPVWLLLPKRPDWRWLLDRDDSPWYPTMRLFRQQALGDWDSVIQCVCTELEK